MWFRLSGIYMHLYSFWKTWLFKIIFKKNTNKVFGHLNSKFKGRSGPPQKGHFEEPGPGAGVQFGDAPSHWSQKKIDPARQTTGYHGVYSRSLWTDTRFWNQTILCNSLNSLCNTTSHLAATYSTQYCFCGCEAVVNWIHHVHPQQFQVGGYNLPVVTQGQSLEVHHQR